MDSDGRAFASASADGTVALWDAVSHRRVNQLLACHQGQPVHRVRWSRNLQSARREVGGLAAFLSAQSQIRECHGLTLESYLLKPIQRLTKYPLFWKDLLKSVPRTHPDRAALEKADELVRTVSQAVNAKLNEELARIKTVQMLSLCLAHPQPLSGWSRAAGGTTTVTRQTRRHSCRGCVSHP